MYQFQLTQAIMDFIELLDGFSILDRDGCYLYVSQRWCREMGIRGLEELKGRKAWEIFPETVSKSVLETGKTVIGHPVKFGIDGKPSFVNYYPIWDGDGNVAGCYTLVMISGIDNAVIVQNQIHHLFEQLDFLEKELKRSNGAHYTLNHIIGNSEQIVRLKKKIRKIAISNSTVLIEGETGTGKELVAHAIHQLSRRNTNNFVKVNCAAIPQELMESEFFGYEKGSFTGASGKGKIGRFQFADKGTIFLDEINSLPMTMQPKFLRVLQEHEIEPVGSNKSIPVDIRVIAAANNALEEQVANGMFRQDLYYRLNVVRVKVPPLRERKEDIPLLTEALIKRLNRALGMCIQSVSNSAMKMLMEYEWPGNIRELQNSLESAMNIAESPILQKEDFVTLSEKERTQNNRKLMLANNYNLHASKIAFEKDLVMQVLRMCENNHAKASQILGISRTMLYKKIAEYQIET